MSNSVLINTLNTYIGTALYNEFLGKNPEESEYSIYGTYFEKDSSVKPLGVKKMMKVNIYNSSVLNLFFSDHT
jgi:hypothetical protein